MNVPCKRPVHEGYMYFGKGEGSTGTPFLRWNSTRSCWESTVSRVSSVEVVVVKVRHKEQTRELLAVGGCLSGPMAVMCHPLPRSLMCPLCTTTSFVLGKKKRTHTRSEHKEQERAAARSAVIEARLRQGVAFRTCQKEVAPNGVRVWISEPPRRHSMCQLPRTTLRHAPTVKPITAWMPTAIHGISRRGCTYVIFCGKFGGPTATAQRSLHFRVIRRGRGEGTTSGFKAQCGHR